MSSFLSTERTRGISAYSLPSKTLSGCWTFKFCLHLTVKSLDMTTPSYTGIWKIQSLFWVASYPDGYQGFYSKEEEKVRLVNQKHKYFNFYWTLLCLLYIILCVHIYYFILICSFNINWLLGKYTIKCLFIFFLCESFSCYLLWI